MFRSPENSPSQPNVVDFPFPEKAEDVRAVHIEELDKRFGFIMDIYKKMKMTHLGKFDFQTLQGRFIDAGISEDVLEKYLSEKGITWGEMKSDKQRRIEKLEEQYSVNSKD
jgi:hypothetical protein